MIPTNYVLAGSTSSYTANTLLLVTNHTP